MLMLLLAIAVINPDPIETRARGAIVELCQQAGSEFQNTSFCRQDGPWTAEEKLQMLLALNAAI